MTLNLTAKDKRTLVLFNRLSTNLTAYPSNY